MQISTIAALFTLASSAFAQGWRPNFRGGWRGNGNGDSKPFPPQNNCLNETGVAYLVQGYTYLLQSPGGPNFNSTAETILSDKFVVISDSINSLAGRPLNQPSFPSKQAFIASQAVTPPLPTVQTLGTFSSCNQIAWRWNASGIGSNKLEIKGMITMDVDVDLLQIDAVYSEFNTAAFQTNLGNPECQTQQR